MTDTPPPEPSTRGLIAAFTLLTVAIVGAIILLLATRPQPVQITIHPPIPTSTLAPTTTPGPIQVYVTGSVAAPELLTNLPSGSRVADAIEAAGGALPGADLSRVNLAQLLRDGDQIHVPALTDEAVTIPTAGASSAVVYINSATVEELDTLPGVGPALAQRIIEYRTANGSFTSMDTLDAVSGIGPALLIDLEGLISFD